MLAKSKKEAERLREISNTDFRFYLSDISSSLPLDDRMCDVVVANLLICYVTCGWQRAIQEMARVLKTGGYIYLGTLLENWGFISVLWKHAPVEFIRAPLESFRGLKYRSIVHDISKELTKSGAVFPSRKELAQFMELIGFEEMYIVPTYWGGGLALRARLH
jgi:ubiquinone/menaquinone biosynthesis C-methylase UbiE